MSRRSRKQSPRNAKRGSQPSDPASRGRGRRGAPAGQRRGTFAGWLLRWTAVAAIWSLLILAGIVGWYAYGLPDIAQLDAPPRRPSVSLYAADGSLYTTFGDLYGKPSPLASLPPHVPRAVLAVEDVRFYDHFGIDLWGLARALQANIRAGKIVQGGSTVTQQVAKVLFLTPERTVSRKIREALLALKLERRFSKDQILNIYLNRVYMGAGSWGIDAAARRYFAKSAARLNLYEAAVIAGLLRAPSRYNPARSPDRAHKRAVLVLDAMVAAGFATAAEAKQAKKQRGRAVATTRVTAQRYFADWVLERARDYVGATGRDLVVHTTLEPGLQRIAERQAAALMDKAGKKAAAGQVALVALSPEGAVRAMVGGRDYGDSQFNRATQALRQPGSAFKPFVYLAALETGLDPDSRFQDAPVSVGKWRPRNYTGRYAGEVTLREAVTRSLNSVAVRVTEEIGRQRVIDTARRLGITSPLRAHPSIALGASEVTPLELTAAYAPFANGGFGVWPFGITEIRDSAGRLLYRRSGSGPGLVVDPVTVAEMNDLLGAVITSGTGRAAALDRPAAGKTGTSQDFRDAWFVGYTADLVTGIWMGNDNGKPMNRVTGGGLPARLWQGFMSEALKGRPSRPLPGLADAEEPGSVDPRHAAID